MAYLLGDVYIGDFPLTQRFGERPSIYSARYGIKGHNGIDIGCPSLTPILAAADGFVSEIGFDSGGYGNYIKLVHDGYLTLYAHLNDMTVKKGDHLIAGNLIAHSNNTGNSDAPHLHFGVAPCDASGNKTQMGNGYSGYIDPMSSLCHWDIKNLTAPVILNESPETPITITPAELSTKTVQANNFQSVVAFGMNHGLGVFLTNNGESLDLTNNPTDENGATKVNKFIADLIYQLDMAKRQPHEAPVLTEERIKEFTPEQKDSFIGGVANLLRSLKIIK